MSARYKRISSAHFFRGTTDDAELLCKRQETVLAPDPVNDIIYCGDEVKRLIENSADTSSAMP